MMHANYNQLGMGQVGNDNVDGDLLVQSQAHDEMELTNMLDELKQFIRQTKPSSPNLLDCVTEYFLNLQDIRLHAETNDTIVMDQDEENKDHDIDYSDITNKNSITNNKDAHASEQYQGIVPNTNQYLLKIFFI